MYWHLSERHILNAQINWTAIHDQNRIVNWTSLDVWLMDYIVCHESTINKQINQSIKINKKPLYERDRFKWFVCGLVHFAELIALIRKALFPLSRHQTVTHSFICCWVEKHT